MRPETRRKVIKAAKTLGYVSNAQASHLRSQRPWAIRVILVVGSLKTAGTEILPFMELVMNLARKIADNKLDMLFSVQEAGFDLMNRRDKTGVAGTIVLGEKSQRAAWLYANQLDEEDYKIVEWEFEDCSTKYCNSQSIKRAIARFAADSQRSPAAGCDAKEKFAQI